MSKPVRVYLDNAATSWPKPESVYEAVDRYQRDLGAPTSRSAYREAAESEREIQNARHAIARLLGVADPHRIIFTLNGTDSLNVAIHGLVRPGDHVVTSVCDHNSVLRPLRWLEENHDVRVTRVGCDRAGLLDPDDVCSALRADTRLVALSHASNVTGTIQPLDEIGGFLRDHPALFLIDAAQTIGHRPVLVEQLHVDLVAAPGHKALLGPLGTGVLYIGPKAEHEIRSVRQGGTGTQSEQDRQPDSLPDKLESGNHNVLGIFGLAAGVQYVNERGITAIEEHGRRLTQQLLAGLQEVPLLRVLGPDSIDLRVPVVSFTIDGYDPQEVCVALDSAHRVQTRGGFHCAPLIHEAIGTAASGGTVRLSTGPFTTSEEIDAAISAVTEIASTPLIS